MGSRPQHRPIPLSLQGWPARILQHEIDHLRGVLCIDRMHSRTFTSLRNHGRQVDGRTVSALLSAVGDTDEVDAPLAGATVD